MRLSPELCKSRVMPTVYLGIYRFCMIKLLYCVERNCGSASFWCRSGSGSDFPFWCRSRSGSGLASKQRRSTWSYRYPKLYTVQCTVGTCWKIGHFLDFYLRQCQSHQSQILHDFVFWTAYWNCHEKKIKKYMCFTVLGIFADPDSAKGCGSDPLRFQIHNSDFYIQSF